MIVSILFVYVSALKKKKLAADSKPLGCVELINVTTGTGFLSNPLTLIVVSHTHLLHPALN